MLFRSVDEGGEHRGAVDHGGVDDLALADRHLQALRGEGCLVCLDDFGAGLSSLSLLRSLPLDGKVT